VEKLFIHANVMVTNDNIKGNKNKEKKRWPNKKKRREGKKFSVV